MGSGLLAKQTLVWYYTKTRQPSNGFLYRSKTRLRLDPRGLNRYLAGLHADGELFFG
jgi:hypothetical protein